MKVNINGEVRDYPVLWREGSIVKMIDQRLLPHKVVVIELQNHCDIIAAIRDMAVRGAPAIGVAGGYGVAQAALEAKDKSKKEFQAYINEATNNLRATRPTAVAWT